MHSLLDLSDDLSLEASRTQRLSLGSALRKSLELAEMDTAPASGACFTAVLMDGRVVTAERFDEFFVAGTTGAPSRLLDASEFAGWLRGSEETEEPYVLSERQEAAAYRAEEYDLDRSMGREE